MILFGVVYPNYTFRIKKEGYGKVFLFENNNASHKPCRKAPWR